ncbi:bifunctional 5,10-methylenetetrahydrofolate dehydrogenase/5,10-methenyltetrahydrofolate cyclohydrolase [Candidatus Gottesmanbacteria bacterium]|nr:bifunctional 5,10-methylenetetrahydrofolate dehydrogenase/5,10-methenyltetrahydrofolate cyclohydrolase [Candidatus Gottesmanbacteria bacterium]
MKIDGKAIAEQILTMCSKRVLDLKHKGTIPTMAVIQVGDDPASTAYINQKKKAAERIGALLIHKKLPTGVTYQHVNMLICEYNTNPAIHGVIIQQPLPHTLGDSATLIGQIDPKKDIDGFLPNSPYPVPVASAVVEILRSVFSQFDSSLNTKNIVVIGRGATAGKPIADLLISRGLNPTVIHSQTNNSKEIIKTADIVVSCVGKPNIVRRDNIKRDAVLISVGIWRDSSGKLHGDYEEDAIKDIAGSYTPTPGGVGPVNVACLMQNLISAAINS